MNVPVITCDAPLADDAFAVYAALMRAARDNPNLFDNPLWCAFRSVAFDRFELAFEVNDD